MKSLIFDTGPLISLTMNNLLWLLPPLKKQFQGNFYITPSVKKELIDKPLSTKKFEWEALQILRHINQGTLEITKLPLQQRAREFLQLANTALKAQNQPIQIVHQAEVETLVAASLLKSPGVVIDERTVRLVLEDPSAIARLLRGKLHTKISYQKNKLQKIRQQLTPLKIIRSSELVSLAYHLRLFDPLIPKIKHGKKILLDALLWGLKTDGCAISKDEIEKLKSLLLK